MALASIKNRIERLEAKHKANANRVVGVIGGAYGQLAPNPDKPGHLMFSQPPEGFAAFAANQQSDLQALLRELAENLPQAKRPAGSVGNDTLAPIPKGKKRPKFIEVEGIGEIEIAKFKGFTR